VQVVLSAADQVACGPSGSTPAAKVIIK